MLLLQVKDLIRRKAVHNIQQLIHYSVVLHILLHRAVQIQQLEVHMQMRIPFHG